MCIAKQPKAPINPAGYVPEDGYKQFNTTIGPEDEVRDRPYVSGDQSKTTGSLTRM